VDRLQFLDPRQARLALGAAALGVAARPLEFLGDRLLARLLLVFLALEAVFLLHQPLGVVALPRDAAAAVEFEDPFGGVVEEGAVRGDGDDGAGVSGGELLQPFDRFGVEVVGGSSSSSMSGFCSSRRHSATRRFSPPDSLPIFASHGGSRSASAATSSWFSRVCASPAARIASSRSCSLARASKSAPSSA